MPKCPGYESRVLSSLIFYIFINFLHSSCWENLQQGKILVGYGVQFSWQSTYAYIILLRKDNYGRILLIDIIDICLANCEFFLTR